ncbi:MAG: ParB/RepB/Spo0J family partition protein [Gammaproteobacteria bacterium]|nr:ParB/RepB/Spo0J family partition protein [Gammaproteobacteria bacterium]MYH84890.1 ParB/RepB/Spo0J family partition protein [Gammaproteobacteria bacterium]MYK03667.1 ParB/RepB/Spo0J family partition protein [Gammaproteobacteria bacterium]
MSRKLGKGLEALLGSRDKESMSALMEDGPAAPAQEGELREIPIDLIRPGKFQPRQDMRAQALEELAQSIHRQGVMQPVVVREIGQGRFELIAGERRWRACQLSGLKAIPALVKSASDRDVVSMSLIENIQREDLNPIEQAAALQRLQEEFGFTQQEVAKEVGKSRESVANLLRLLGLEPDVRAMLEKGELEMGHARALLGVSGPDQPKLAREVARKQLSVRQTEDLVRRHQSRADATPTTRERDPDLARLEESLSEKLGARVAIQHTAKGKGKLVINYNNVTELEGILSHIK